MAVTEEIAWGDGSGDKIYLTADAFGGNQTVLVSSDANAGVARTKTVTFSATGITPVTLTVVQAGGIQPVFYDFLLFDGTAYIDTDILPDEDSTFACVLGAESQRAAQRVFGFSGSGGTYYGIYLGSDTSSTSRSIAAFYGASSAVSTNTLSFGNLSYSLFMTPKRYGWGDTTYTYTKGSGVPSSVLVIGFNGGHSGQAYTGAFGMLRVFGSDAQNATTYSELENYTPAYTLRPCKYGADYGLWNVEEGKFYGNTANAGTLVAANRIGAIYPSSYDSTNHSYYSVSSLSNGYTACTSTTYATINLTRGSGAETYVYYKFDTSAIPANATIVAVVCAAKSNISNTSSSNIATRQLQLYSGVNTSKGANITIPSSASFSYFSRVSWTREEVSDLRIRVYAKRGTSNTSTNYFVRFYGATLQVYYTL